MSTQFSQLLVLDSGDVYNASNPNITGTYDDFTIVFNRPLQIPDNTKMALLKLNTYYTWSIVSQANNNNRFQIIRSTPATTYTVTLADGIYSLLTLNSALLDAFTNHFGYTGDVYSMPIQFGANQAISKFFVQINDVNYSLNISPTGSLFYQLIGFNATTQPLLITQTTVAANVGNINFNIDNYLLHCDVVQSSVINNDVSKNVIYSFVPQVEIGSNIHEEPVTKIYLPVERKEYISSLRIYLTDNKLRRVNLQEALVLTLHLQN